eukprot:Skav200656  [mRNA]  locus=scaffold2539:171422:174595:+ [translate_table: standard]
MNFPYFPGSRAVRGLQDGPVLGVGGWSIVRRADFCGCDVAVKTFNHQALKEDQSVRHDRFLREVTALKSVGARATSVWSNQEGFFVKLLGYSKEPGGAPGPTAGGGFYTILELGEESLDQWLRKVPAVQPADFVDVSKSLFSALHHLHSRGLAHMDVKPENIMRFDTCRGKAWKFIDLECCMPIGGQLLSADNITPLYASPELAKAATAASKTGASMIPLPPSSEMDIWAAGVVLLDVLAEGCCFGEMKASFDLQALFEEEEFTNESWLLQGPQHHRGRRIVEEVFSVTGQEAGLPLYSCDMLMEVLVCIGVSAQDAKCMLDALCQHLGCTAFSCSSFLNFLYSA